MYAIRSYYATNHVTNFIAPGKRVCSMNSSSKCKELFLRSCNLVTRRQLSKPSLSRQQPTRSPNLWSQPLLRILPYLLP